MKKTYSQKKRHLKKHITKKEMMKTYSQKKKMKKKSPYSKLIILFNCPIIVIGYFHTLYKKKKKKKKKKIRRNPFNDICRYTKGVKTANQARLAQLVEHLIDKTIIHRVVDLSLGIDVFFVSIRYI